MVLGSSLVERVTGQVNTYKSFDQSLLLVIIKTEIPALYVYLCIYAGV